MTKPSALAEGRNGRWVKLGEAGVDSAHLAITDPAFAPGEYSTFGETEPGFRSAEPDLAHTYGSGVQFLAGFGDGTYEVWAWIADYGCVYEGETEWTPDERIAQIVVTLINEGDFEEWYNNS